MTSQNAKKRAAPWSQADRRQSSSSVSPPPSPKRSEAWRKNLTLEECREGLVVYLPKEENIPKTSRIHHQPRGGNKWSHPHVITGVDEVTGFVQIRTVSTILLRRASHLRQSMSRLTEHHQVPAAVDRRDACCGGIGHASVSLWQPTQPLFSSCTTRPPLHSPLKSV